MWLTAIACLLSSLTAGAAGLPMVVHSVAPPGPGGDSRWEAMALVLDAEDRAALGWQAFPLGFLPPQMGADPSAVPAGPAIGLEHPGLRAFVAGTSNQASVVLVALVRRVGNAYRHSVLVIHAGRLLGVQDQVMVPGRKAGEPVAEPGSQVSVFEANGVRFGVLLGADAAVPHLALHQALQGATMTFVFPQSTKPDSSSEDSGEDELQRLSVSVGIIAVRIPESPGARLLVVRDGKVARSAGPNAGGRDSLELAVENPPRASAMADVTAVPGWLRSQLGALLDQGRPPASDTALRSWLESMVVAHRFSSREAAVALGMTETEVESALVRLGLNRTSTWSPLDSDGRLRVLPYPGGRHPRRGFFDGAVAPQRETKVSVFLPWPDAGYAVVDVPEAVFSNLGLLYLAHTHIPTVWDREGVTLPRLEWKRGVDGVWTMDRTLPNGVVLGSEVRPGREGVRMSLSLHNGTRATLTGLRVQNCVMLAGAAGFEAQSLTNKVFAAPFAAVRSATAARWMITAWQACGRAWGNELVPCLHSDPVFPDCEPGQTVRLQGWLSFHEGERVEPEFARLKALGVLDPVP